MQQQPPRDAVGLLGGSLAEVGFDRCDRKSKEEAELPGVGRSL